MAWTYEFPHPAVTVDVAIFTLDEAQLKILLIRRANPPHQGDWALPGGFVDIDESLKRAAFRELREETGVRAAYLEQLYTFGHPDRDPRERIITVAYLALLPPDRIEVEAASDAADARWFAVDDLPPLAFDHARIFDKALARLRGKLSYSTIAFPLLPAEFTLAELQRVYEVVGGKALDKRNFRRRMLNLGLLEATGEHRRGGAHRPAELYRIKGERRVRNLN